MGDLPDDLALLSAAGSGRFRDVRVFAEVDSTNSLLLEEAAGGAPSGLVVVADHQRAGRGRLGRTWDAASGAALLTSVLLRPRIPVADVPLLPLAAAVDMAGAVDDLCGAGVSIKWPNDLRLGGRKLGGVLAETRNGGGLSRAVVVGVGLNVSRGAFPSELSDIAVSLEDGGHVVARADLLAAFLARYSVRADIMEADLAAGRDRLLEELRARCETLGTHVRVRLHTTGDTVVVGEATGLGPRGELLVRRHDGSKVAVDHGEVEQLRPA
jgi:BirA family biotin operon repressor/biotin-[acetyl-CoA-carboxylase] ligase